MQTVSSKIRSILVLSLMIWTGTAIARNTEIFLKNQASTTTLVIQGRVVNAKNTRNKKPLRIFPKLKKILMASDEVLLMPKSHTLDQSHFILLSRTLSRPKAMGNGYCGGGYEENLLLIKIQQSSMELSDQIELQSCLHSILLYIESPTSSTANLINLRTDGSYEYRLEGDESDQYRKLIVEQGKFKIQVMNEKSE